MQLLAIDQGNTRTKLGLFEDGALKKTSAFPTQKAASPADLEQAVFTRSGFPRDARIGLCTVAPEAVPAWDALAARVGCSLTVLTGTSPTPLTNAYATPRTLGPDRLLAAVAAANAAGAPVISISLGTAMVVDAVSADRAYLGGMIAPGIGLAERALVRGTSALRAVTWKRPAQAIGRSTEESLVNGWFYHSIGSLREMIAATRKALGVAAPLVLTGGWARQIAPHLDGVAQVDQYLVLRGIMLTLAE
ncbi:MAG: type III pantothenate kinase [Armatimonadota bacterium]